MIAFFQRSIEDQLNLETGSDLVEIGDAVLLTTEYVHTRSANAMNAKSSITPQKCSTEGMMANTSDTIEYGSIATLSVHLQCTLVYPCTRSMYTRIRWVSYRREKVEILYGAIKDPSDK